MERFWRKRIALTAVSAVIILTVFLGGPLYQGAAYVALASNVNENAARMQLEEIQRQQQENQQNQSNTLNKLSEAQEEKEETQNTRDTLSQQAGEIEKKVGEFTTQLTAVNKEIAETEGQINTLGSEIEEMEKKLSDAKVRQEEAYQGLKSRIAFLYENDTRGSLVGSLLMSSSIADFLRRIEYVNSLMAYDDGVLSDYEALIADIETKQAELDAKQTELAGYKDTLDVKKAEASELVSSASSSLSAKRGEVDAADQKLSDLDEEIEDYAELLATYEAKRVSLESAAAQAQAQLAQALAAQQQQMMDSGVRENTSAAVAASASDTVLLAATIQAEADNQPYEGKLAVASVIMNRVNSSLFPNSISGVITQSGQFASWSSGKVSLIVERGPNESCMSVAEAAINGTRNGDWLFFMTKYWADYFGVTDYTMIGAHAFFYSWPRNSGSSSEAGSNTDAAAEQTTEEQVTEQQVTEEQVTEEQVTEQQVTEQTVESVDPGASGDGTAAVQ
ncbi:MAG: cell wall hydrolase [Lachnospiraceae bacterium]|nr:cell wall hydrolase [Lachnospiraceae bacterium]